MISCREADHSGEFIHQNDRTIGSFTGLDHPARYLSSWSILCIPRGLFVAVQERRKRRIQDVFEPRPQE